MVAKRRASSERRLQRTSRMRSWRSSPSPSGRSISSFCASESWQSCVSWCNPAAEIQSRF
eukprot:4437623-Prymnesium_polylepis.2